MKLGPESVVYVAEKEDQILGTVTLAVRDSLLYGGKKVAYLEEMAIRSGYHGKSIEDQLCDHAIGVAKQKGCSTIFVPCTSDFARYFEKKGFIYGNKVIMRMDL